VTALSLLVFSAASFAALGPAGDAARCAPVPIYEGGAPRGGVCPADAPARGLVVVDLRDDWVPLPIADTPYAEAWVALANERFDVEGLGRRAASDRYLEVWGIPPSLSILRARLEDAARHACDDAIDDGALLASAPAPGQRAPRDVVRVAQAHLACAGLLDGRRAGGRLDAATARALALFQRREALLSPPGALDEDTRARLAASSRARDFAALERALIERVVEAAGLLEDGSAHWDAWARGAPDVVEPAARAALVALGLDDEGVAAERLRALPPFAAVALRVPAYHDPNMDLFAEIELGEPIDDDQAGGRDAPTFSLYARVGGAPLRLVSWPTTQGGPQREKVRDDVRVVDKSSPEGAFVWRALWAAPSWYPPPTTPDDELVLRVRGGVVVNDETIGPSYRSAYGLAMLPHELVRVERDGDVVTVDTAVRTHGTGNPLSVVEAGPSHGCHRLLPRDALRLANFLLRHRAHGVPVQNTQAMSRDLEVRGARLHLERRSRGTVIPFDEPIPIEVRAMCRVSG